PRDQAPPRVDALPRVSRGDLGLADASHPGHSADRWNARSGRAQLSQNVLARLERGRGLRDVPDNYLTSNRLRVPEDVDLNAAVFADLDTLPSRHIHAHIPAPAP